MGQLLVFFLSAFGFGGCLLDGKMTMTGETLLHEYARTGSEEAFTTLVSQYFNLVYTAAIRQLSDSELARDVAQMVFTDLARKARTISPQIPLAGWLYRSTTFAAAKVRRTEQRRLRREREASAMHNPGSEPETEWEQLQPLLDECLAVLGEKDRIIVLLRFFERMNLKQVGEAVGLSDEAAQKRTSRALEKMRLFFTGRGMTISAVALPSLLVANSVLASPHGLAATIAAASLADAGSVVSVGLTFKLMSMISSSKAKAAVVSIVLVGVFATPLVLQGGGEAIGCRKWSVARASTRKSPGV
jgi:RNA polymerase sigma factor (sigma-70 family)